MDIERHNHQQIEQRNQRGGRTLSIVDLIQAGTLSVEMAAYAMQAMHQGASLLTGARPGGAGKTALMAAILNFLPPQVPLITVDGSHVISEGLKRSAADPACYLAHEIGSDAWYGCIWGRDVADFFSLIDRSRRIASCLHADTLHEVTDNHHLVACSCGPRRRVLDKWKTGQRCPLNFKNKPLNKGHRYAKRRTTRGAGGDSWGFKRLAISR